jgi:multipile epidermal growth factor-like domains protein 8
MLILLYSDTNYNLDGFRAVFSVTNCLNNCSKNGLCSNHECLCTGDWSGIDCSTKVCNCGDAENRGFCHKNGCKCLNDFSGQSCSLHKFKAETSQWFWLTNGTQSFTPRAAHTAVYSDESDELFVFGGYDLNRVLGAMEVFQFKENRWIDGNGKVLEVEVNKKAGLKNFLLNSSVSDQFWFRAALLSHVNAPEIEEVPDSVAKIEPSPRYGHAACSLKNSFIIYGGKLADGSLSNQLWLFNFTTRSWSLRAQNSSLTPPHLTRHALTFVPSNNFIYLFGGSLENSEFSSKMLRINADDLEEWEFVHPRGGKSFDYRVVAHSMNYHTKSNSLLIYGGIIAGVSRFSKLSDRMFSFNLNDNHWTEIYYPRTALREVSIPRERAFHTATIAGDILIVFGGYSHRHNKEESQCYDNQMYFYHLDCHSWINQEALGGQRGLYPKRQGVFAHAAVLRGDNTLLLVGGYHGIVNNDLLAFSLPDMMVPSR